MKPESPDQFISSTEQVPQNEGQEAAQDAMDLLARVQARVAEEQVVEGESSQGVEVALGDASVKESASPYAAPESLGLNVELPPLKESQVLYPGADAPLHKPIEANDVRTMGEDAANPHGFKEVA